MGIRKGRVTKKGGEEGGGRKRDKDGGGKLEEGRVKREERGEGV